MDSCFPGSLLLIGNIVAARKMLPRSIFPVTLRPDIVQFACIQTVRSIANFFSAGKPLAMPVQRTPASCKKDHYRTRKNNQRSDQSFAQMNFLEKHSSP